MPIEGKEVLLTVPQFSRAPKITASRATSMVSLSDAARVQAYIGKTALHSFTAEYLFRTRAEIAAFEDFFYDRAGKWESFWLPGWHAELNLAASLLSGATAVPITAVDYANVYDPLHAETKRLGHYAYLHDADGTIHTSLVTAASGPDANGQEWLTLGTATGKAYTLGQCYLGFLYHVRFAADELRLEWSGVNEAKTQVGFLEAAQATSLSDA